MKALKLLSFFIILNLLFTPSLSAGEFKERSIQVTTRLGDQHIDDQVPLTFSGEETSHEEEFQIGGAGGEQIDGINLIGPWPAGTKIQQRFITVLEIQGDTCEGCACNAIYLLDWRQGMSEWKTLPNKSLSFYPEPFPTDEKKISQSFPLFKKKDLDSAIDSYFEMNNEESPDKKINPAAFWKNHAYKCKDCIRPFVYYTEFRVLIPDTDKSDPNNSRVYKVYKQFSGIVDYWS